MEERQGLWMGSRIQWQFLDAFKTAASKQKRGMILVIYIHAHRK